MITSTAPAVIDALLTAVNVDLPGDVRAFESWPGPDGAEEMVVLGLVEWEDYDIASIKAGRQQRNEVYTVGFDIYVFGKAGTTPAVTKPARDRAFTLLSTIEDLLAEDPAPNAPTVAWLQVRPTAAEPRVFEKAWAYRVAGTIHVTARLT